MKAKFFLTALIICIVGCKKSPDNLELVNEMVKDAKESNIPISEEEIRDMAKKVSEMPNSPQYDFDSFFSMLRAKNYENAYSDLSEELKKKWSKDAFFHDIQRFCVCIGENWNPQQMEFMNYQTPSGPVCTASYQLTNDFKCPYVMNFVCIKKDNKFDINAIKIVFPYQGEDNKEMQQKALDFLLSVQNLDVEKARETFVTEYKDQIQVPALQQINEIMWDNDNKAMKIGEIEETIMDGKCIYRVLADSQIHPLVKLEIFLQKDTSGISVAGANPQGRIKM